MNTSQKKVIVIASVILAFIVVPLVIFGIYKATTTPDTSGKITSNVDPITGDEIIDGGTLPENDTEDGVETNPQPLLYGFDNISALYGNDDAFSALRSSILNVQFPNAKVIKIAQKDIVKKVFTESDGVADPYIAVDFSVYLDDNTKDSYRLETKFMTTLELLNAKITDPAGKVTELSTDIYGHD